MELQTIDQMMIVDYQGALINWDNKQLIELANNTVNKYKNLVVTADMTKDIKKEVATLNKLVKGIEDKRKAIKKDYNAPLNVFEGNVKEVTAIINTAVDDLKKQLDIFEQIRRDKITVQLREIDDELQKEFNLSPKYRGQIVVKESFYNITANDEEILNDMRQQFAVLANAQELEQLKIKQEQERVEREATERENKIKARYELINKMNAETGINFNYDNTKHYNDANLMIAYQKELKAIADAKNRAEQEKIRIEELKKQQNIQKDTTVYLENEIIEQVAHVSKVLEETKNKYYAKTDCHSLLIENLTKAQMDLIIAGLKLKMPAVTFKEV